MGGWGDRAYGHLIITQRSVRACKSHDRVFSLARLFVFSDGKVIEYLHDHLGRRIAKKVDGVIVAKYLWRQQRGTEVMKFQCYLLVLSTILCKFFLSNFSEEGQIGTHLSEWICLPV